MRHERHEQPSMYVASMDACVNRWFKTYEEAKASLEGDGGYLFPYRSQYFVTDREAVRELGLDPDDPDWELIGFDWVKPLDSRARQRLLERRLLVLGERQAL